MAFWKKSEDPWTPPEQAPKSPGTPAHFWTASWRSAAMPPTVQRYTLPVSLQACTTSGLRLPLPMAATMPAANSCGVAKSMRLAVVGPTEPKGRPAAAGVGPA